MADDSNFPSLRNQLVLRYQALASLKPDPANARTHDKRQVAQIARSITVFGFCNPILIDADGVIIAGHGRYLAAKKLGLRDVPTISLPHLNGDQKRALRIADNKIGLNSSWNFDLLKAELQQLAVLEIDFDLSLTGFTPGEIDVVLQGAPDPDDEVIPAIPATPRTRPGDIWVLGEHRLGCGDARDLAFLRRVVGDRGPIDVAFLDPPYNVRISGHANTSDRHREFAMASGEMSQAAFIQFLEECLGAAVAVSRNGAVHFVCMDWRHTAAVQTVGARIYGEQINLCVWNKSNAGMGSLYRSKHELVFVYRVGEAPHLNAVELGKHGRNRTNVWDYASVNSFKGSRRGDLELHPTVKPAAMVADAIKDVTRQGGLVLDTFLGSGTTLLAAERSGRRCRGVELDPAYVDLAIERWSDLTGKEARLEDGEVL
jgi:DNA modification methylase